MANGILISFAGYPYTPSSLMPDNGLANLAGSLIGEGHQALIIDYGTVDYLSRLVPDPYRMSLEKIYRASQKEKKGALAKSLNDMSLFINLNTISRRLAKFQADEVDRIAIELLDIIDKERPDFVGFKLWLGDGFAGSVKMAQTIRKGFPHIKVFAGGPLACMCEEAVYEAASVFDAVCYSEGEEAIVGLAEYADGKRALAEIPNILFREKNGIKKTENKRIENLDALALPVYDEDVYPAMKGDRKIKVIVIDESRGCPYRCNFCPHSGLSGSHWRVKSPDRIAEEIKLFIERHSIHAFRYAGSCTPANVVEDVAGYIMREGLDVVYTSFAHARTTNSENLPLLKRSGLTALFFGIESGDETILKNVMSKKLSPEDIKKNMKASIDAGIFTVGSIISPAPSETEDSKRHTLDLLLDIYTNRLSGAVPVQFPGLYPKTEWFRDPAKYGFKLYSPSTYKRDMLDYKIKLLFPPRYWKKMPYEIDGKPYGRFSKETGKMISELEKHGILTMLSDELALIGMLAGYAPREYRDRSRFNFYCGNWQAIIDEIKTINKNITCGPGMREKIRSRPFGL